MSVLSELVTQSIEEDGLKGFSFTMPVCAQKWVAITAADITGTVSFDEDALSLNTTGSIWMSPFPVQCRFVNDTDNRIDISLFKADGTPLTDTGILFTLYPQQVLKLKRLVAAKSEIDAAHNPRKAQGLPIRQVPAYYFLNNSTITDDFVDGNILSGQDMGFDGELTFYDEDGNIIHPIYLASLMKLLITQYPALLMNAMDPDQLSSIISLYSSSGSDSFARVINADGSLYADDKLDGVTTTSHSGSNGVFSISAFSGADTTISGEIKRKADTGNAGTFPSLTASQMLITLATYGRLSDKVQIAKLPTGTTIIPDFFTIKVFELKSFLLGEKEMAFAGSKFEPAVPIRLHEDVSLLTSGNEVMGGIQNIFSGTLTESLCVATQINPAFPLPSTIADSQWPAFPATPTVTTENGNFPIGYKDLLQANATATFITPASPGQPTDIQLVLKGLPLGASVRAFHRLFLVDALVKRGDGSGGVVINTGGAVSGTDFTGQITLDFKDPLGLKHLDGTITVPAPDARFYVDILINMKGATPRRRLFGNVELPIGTTTVAASAAVPDNVAALAARKGISNSAILGIDTAVLNIDLSSLDGALNSILQLTGETNPRDASRYPTMARRDLLCAALESGAWKGLVSGGRISKDLHCGQLQNGSPGSLGGRETCYNGVLANNNRLAIDLARMAFRRTTSFYTRIIDLANANWNEPVAKTQLAEGDSPSAGRGFTHGAILQTIAPNCETPEMAILKTVAEAQASTLPATWNDLVDLVVGWINGISTSGLSGLLGTAANRLKTELVTKLNGLKDNNPANEARNERLFNELKREISSSCFGRRDSQWALQKAIQRARHFIYIESPGLSFTEGENPRNYTVDLLDEIQNRLEANPALRVMICIPKIPDYGIRYDQWIKREIATRFQFMNDLPSSQLVCFHPIGFPGRPSNLETHTVVVDDNWLLVGSSSLRRRGMTFDGSSDFVCTDGDMILGRSLKIKNFRKSIMAQRLGIDLSNRKTDARPVLLESGLASFNLIRNTLVSGGAGRIERLWNGRLEGVNFSDPSINDNLANPEGIEFDSLGPLLMSLFAMLPK